MITVYALILALLAGVWLTQRPVRPPLARILVANMGGLRSSAYLQQQIDKYQPDIIALSEVPKDRDWYRAIPGYRLHVAPFVAGDMRGLCTLTRKRVTHVERIWDILIRRHWWGPSHGRRHDGKAWQPMRLRIRDSQLRFLDAHFPWGSHTKRNRPAWNEAKEKAGRFLGHDRDIPSAWAGDGNADEDTIRAWAKENGWQYAHISGVTHVVASGDVTVTAERIDPPNAGDAHGWGLAIIRHNAA